MFTVVVASSSLYNIPGDVFIHLLTHFYVLFLLHQSQAPRYSQIYHTWCLLPMLDTVYLFSLLSRKAVLSSSRPSFL